MTSSLPLYLASGSPRRQQLLREAGIAYEHFVIPVDEETLAAEYRGPLELLGEYLARCKAEAAERELVRGGRAGLVLASDTTVLLNGESLAKPANHAEAEVMLRRLRGREHIVATGVALSGPTPGNMLSATSATRVLMRDYGDAEIASYVATGDPLDKAGSYSIQHPSFQPVARIAGCHLGVIGLPLCIVNALTRNAPLPPTCAGERDTRAGVHCPWSSICTPPLPGPNVVHGETPDSTAGV